MFRRRFVLGGLLTVLECTAPVLCCRATAGTRVGTGCWIPASEVPTLFARAGRAGLFETGEEEIERHSGKPELDRALVHSLAMLSKMFDVLPAFAYYHDGSVDKNAKATPQKLLDRADGTVLFGLSLLDDLLSWSRDGDAAVVAVCAHEFGHIVSYKNGDIKELSPESGSAFRAEQYADFLAGYFAGHRKLERPDFPAVVFAKTQWGYGGGDHGTKAQRGEAVEKGFLAAYDQKLTAPEGTRAAFNFAMSRVE
jgi:hypothetical protein